MLRRSIRFVTLAAAVMFLGLASRKYRSHLPTFVGEYSGDTLWALMLYLLISALLARSAIATRASIAFALASLVETSQLYHAPWIDAIRHTLLGRLALGTGFLWSDLICYAVGIATGALVESVITSKVASRIDTHHD